MPSLLVLVFVVELAVQFINTVGAATINNLIWRIVTAVPTNLSKDFAAQRKLQKDFLKARRELNGTSSQDEFAKWAKLRRQHDKLLTELEKKKATLDSTRAKFDTYLTSIRFVLTRGLQYFLPFWYGKVPMFWLPHGWFPYYAEWLLSFPRAPLGSVSITSWQIACTGALAILSDAILAVVGLVLGGQGQQKQAMPTMAGQGTQTKGSSEKKEL